VNPHQESLAFVADGRPANGLVSDLVWRRKYRAGDEATVEATFARVARSLARVRPEYEHRYRELMLDGLFLPAGRILSGSGRPDAGMLLNCFVSAAPEGHEARLTAALEEAVCTLAAGGGVGIDLSGLPPETSSARGEWTGQAPVSWMKALERACVERMGTLAGRSAIMAVLDIRHPDIRLFCAAKRRPGALSQFGLSVRVTGPFVRALRSGEKWSLSYAGANFCSPGAADLWREILDCSLSSGAPGFIFSEQVAAENNLWWTQPVSASNPCGETPLPEHGACLLGSLVLPGFVLEPFTPEARMDMTRLKSAVRTAVRLLNDALDSTTFPLEKQRSVALGARRIGLGVTGLADALILLGERYDRPSGRRLAARVMRTIRDAAYLESCRLSEEAGPFPLFDGERFLRGGFVRRLPGAIREKIMRGGIRNSHLLAIAPAGSISLLAGGVSFGAEPVFSERVVRRFEDSEGAVEQLELLDPAADFWTRLGRRGLPPAFLTIDEITPDDQVAMIEVLQRYVDQAISKTVRFPPDATVEDAERFMDRALRMQLKGFSIYQRPQGVS